MKLSKRALMNALILATEKTASLVFAGAQNALQDGTLEIEGYSRKDHLRDTTKMVDEWTRFDPNDEATYPQETAEYIVALDGFAFAQAVAFYESDNAFDTDEVVTHWRPLPKRPTEQEENK